MKNSFYSDWQRFMHTPTKYRVSLEHAQLTQVEGDKI
jgi:hypothetical protein